MNLSTMVTITFFFWRSYNYFSYDSKM